MVLTIVLKSSLCTLYLCSLDQDLVEVIVFSANICFQFKQPLLVTQEAVINK